MARPKKERVICAMPRFLDFSPTTGKSGDTQVLCFDEYEVIRLHDLEHFSQEETARQMLISRPTVTELLASAHEKLARMLVEGTGLELRGSTCVVCEIGKNCPKSEGTDCPRRRCCKGSCRERCQKQKENCCVERKQSHEKMEMHHLRRNR